MVNGVAERRDNNARLGALVLVLDPLVVTHSPAIVLAIVSVFALRLDNDNLHTHFPLTLTLIATRPARPRPAPLRGHDDAHVAVLVLVLDRYIAAHGLAIILLLVLHVLDLVLPPPRARLSSTPHEFRSAATRMVRDAADNYEQQ